MTTLKYASKAAGARGLLAVASLLLILVCALFAALPAFSCGAPGSGNPSCGGSGAASVGGGSTGSVMAGGGNPINLLSGNKYQEETDLAALPGVLGLELKRYYNSQSSYPGLAGAQWRTSYETVLYDLGTQVQIVQADGRRITLQRGAGTKAHLCVSPQAQDGQVRIEQDGNGNVYHWRWADGRTLTFRSLGLGETTGYPLHGITAPTGERVQLAYNPLGDLSSVTDPQGRKLSFGYGKAAPGQRALLKTVAMPGGRLGYRHDELGRLVEVAHFAGTATVAHVARLYHYEQAFNGGNSFALTGVSVQTADAQGHRNLLRVSTWAYDGRGRAILSTKGRPLQRDKEGKAVDGTGVEQITLQYLQPASPNEGVPDRTGEVQPRPQALGKTLLINSLGETSTLLSAVIGGEFRLVEFTGPGCVTCGPSNRRYGYDAAGRLLRTIELDTRGQPLRAELRRYDAQGRHVETALQAYRDGKPQPAQWRERLEYAQVRAQDGSLQPSLRPSLIAQPSVVAGKERRTQWRYNEHGEVQEVTESGWSRTLSGVAVPIERTTRYGYETRNGRELLVRIDGPLANGPKADPSDSDVTLLRYSQDGSSLDEVVAPGQRRTRVLARDDAGRPARLDVSDGATRVVSEQQWSAEGRLLKLAQAAQKLGVGEEQPALQQWTQYEYDALGRLTSMQASDARHWRTEFDLAGRAVKLLAADGSVVDLTRDLEGRLVALSRGNEGQAAPLQTLQFDYAQNISHQLTAVRDDLGSIASFGYAPDAGGNARPTRVAHADGHVTRYRYDDDGALAEQLIAAGTPEALRRRFIYNAMGQTRGILTEGTDPAAPARALAADYDDFGRKTVQVTPEGGRSLYLWDGADRLLAQADERGGTTAYRYDFAGRLLERRSMASPERVTYGYDGFLRVREVRSLDGKTPVETYDKRHDAWGRLIGERHWVGAAALAVPGGHDLTLETGYQYDPVTGRLAEKRLRDAQGRVHATQYSWDAASGRLRAASFNGRPVLSDLQYAGLGDLRELRYGNGLTETRERDARGRLTRVALREADGVAISLLEQAYEHDAGDRLVRSRLQLGGQQGPELEHRYQYDARSRLVADLSGTAPRPTEQRFEFDALGNRTTDSSTDAGATTRRHLLYRANALQGSVEQSPAGWRWTGYGAETQPIARRTLAGPGEAGAVALRVADEPALPRLVYASGRLDAVLDRGGEARVHYSYGMHGERLSKTVAGVTTWFLYERVDDSGALRLAGEADADGAVLSHYVYVDGQPLARVDTPVPASRLKAAWWQVQTWLMHWWNDAPAAASRIYALHVDQRNAPVLVTDENRRAVWAARYDAFGRATVAQPAAVQAGFTLNLRLPGQYFDAETGLHDNVLRSYDPDMGRYTTPDPLSSRAGLDLASLRRLTGDNAYAYVGNRPLRYTDSQGLYESDIHYYMNYFLAIVAGMGADDARTLALAAQYVDDNPLTKPLDDAHGTWGVVTSIFHNQEQLKKYHFVLTDADGQVLAGSKNTNVSFPNSPQLSALYGYAVDDQGGAVCLLPNDQSLQFMGEFLHAYEDTFAHRKADNTPFNAVWKNPLTGSEYGIGHGLYGSDPDFTYNHTECDSRALLCAEWLNNEARTYEMEKEVYDRIGAYMDKLNYVRSPSRQGTATDFDNAVLQTALKKFNAFQADEVDHIDKMGDKIQILNQALIDLGYEQRLVWAPGKDGGTTGYDKSTAAENRKKNLEGLKKSDYRAAILLEDSPA